MRERVTFRRIIVLIVIVVLGTGGAYVVVDFIRYYVRLQQALSSYRDSRGPRGPAIDSDKFARHGVGLGMTESQVDESMRGATRKTRLLSYEHGVPGFEKNYWFEYEPTFFEPLLGRRMRLVSEWYTVIFDDSRKVVGLERHLFVHGDERSGSTEWNFVNAREKR